MLAFIYTTLQSLGFVHPLHPVATHIPMGMVMGSLLFALASFKWQELKRVCRYCYILALINAPVAAILGIMDWQYKYAGALTNLFIAKLVLAPVIIVFLGGAVYVQKKEIANPTALMALYGIGFLLLGAIGFIGGQIIFG